MAGLKVIHRIGLAVLLPIVVLVAFAGSFTMDRLAEARRMEALGHLVGVARDGNALVHELQAERGLTSAFLGGGKTLGAELAAQRRRADDRLAGYRAGAQAHAGLLAAAGLGEVAQAAEAGLADLAATRAAVDGLALSQPEAFEWYTALIRRLTRVQAALAVNGADGRLVKALRAYQSITGGKEAAGQERAAGAFGLASGAMPLPVYRQVTQLGAVQAVHLDAFRHSAPAALAALYDEVAREPAMAVFEELRGRIAATGPGAAVDGLTPADWFAAASARINLFKRVEDAAGEAAAAQVKGIHVEARSAFLAAAGLSLALVLATLLVTTAVARGISRPLTAMVAAMKTLARGERTDIPALERGDEVGEIARALGTIYRGAVEAQRIKVALDTAPAAMMVTDPQQRIVYLNQALCDLLGRAGNGLDRAEALPALLGRGAVEAVDERRSRVRLGGRTFETVATPVGNERGERLGTVVEWEDLTDAMAIQDEVDGIVGGALAGDLSRRVRLDGKAGFMRRLSQSVNGLLDTVGGAVGDVGHMLRALAEGDLARRIDNDHAGTFGQLRDDANATAEKLAGIVAEIAEAASALNRAATSIAEGSVNLSERTEQQASSLEETAAAMEQLAATVRQNAGSARQASQLADGAKAAADGGGAVAAQAVAAMGRIEESSQKISDIIGVIDEIAFQTNLLALNAAVEAARAGESGKGFAVVAAEVRTLAQRSSVASKEIKALIQVSSGEVRAGVGLVNEAGRTLEQIVQSVTCVADIVADIAAASGEQAQGLEQVNAAVAHMDQVTQKNAALVEESTASARDLQAQAAELHGLVAFFSTADGAAGECQPEPAPVEGASRPHGPVDDGWEDF